MTFSLLSVDKPKLHREDHPDYRAQYYKYTLRKTDSLSTLLYNILILGAGRSPDWRMMMEFASCYAAPIVAGIWLFRFPL